MGLFNTIANVAGLALEIHDDYENHCESLEIEQRNAKRKKLEEAAELGDADAMWDLACLCEQEGDEAVKKGEDCSDSESQRFYAHAIEDSAAERFRWQLRAAKEGHPKAVRLFKTLDPKAFFVIFDAPIGRSVLNVERLREVIFENYRGRLSVGKPEDITFDTMIGTWYCNLDAYAIHIPLSKCFEPFPFRDLCTFVAKTLSCSFSIHFYAKPVLEQAGQKPEPMDERRSAIETPRITGTVCPCCQHPVSSTAKFCPECGAALARKCSSCGVKLELAMKFCPECGTRVVESKRTSTDEPGLAENEEKTPASPISDENLREEFPTPRIETPPKSDTDVPQSETARVNVEDESTMATAKVSTPRENGPSARASEIKSILLAMLAFIGLILLGLGIDHLLGRG